MSKTKPQLCDYCDEPIKAGSSQGDMFTPHASPWFVGDYGFVLANPCPLPEPIAIKGALKFWAVPEWVENEIWRQLES